MRFRIGITDTNWFNYLRNSNPEDVNFWQPRGGGFKALTPGEPFIFKLKYPINKIVGVGFFIRHITLPISVAWETFGSRNGCDTLHDFRKMIALYNTEPNPEIGCIVLTSPVFFKQQDWLEVPEDWSKNIVTGKNFDSEVGTGSKLWGKVHSYLIHYLPDDVEAGKSLNDANESNSPLYGNVLSKVRIGQGAFRVCVTDAYQKRCSITGEKTLPALEAAHIKPYSRSGPNIPANGLLLRSDIHKLFDSGYVTITKDLRVEVSNRIKSEFENGKEYYQFHGRDLVILPRLKLEIPNDSFIEWHNENIFR